MAKKQAEQAPVKDQAESAKPKAAKPEPKTETPAETVTETPDTPSGDDATNAESTGDAGRQEIHLGDISGIGGIMSELGEDDGVEAAASSVAALEAERDELKDRLLRALAETENVRRRAERDRKDAETYGGTRLARDLLTVHDNLGRALSHVDDATREAAKSFIEGVELTQREFLNTFAKHKIEKISPAVGEKFDPHLHQAMFEAPIPGATPGAVIEVIQAGFTISDRLLRPALVGVAKAAPAPANEEPKEDKAEASAEKIDETDDTG